MGAAVATAAGVGVSRRPWLVRAGFGRATGTPSCRPRSA